MSFYRVSCISVVVNCGEYTQYIDVYSVVQGNTVQWSLQTIGFLVPHSKFALNPTQNVFSSWIKNRTFYKQCCRSFILQRHSIQRDSNCNPRQAHDNFATSEKAKHQVCVSVSTMSFSSQFAKCTVNCLAGTKGSTFEFSVTSIWALPVRGGGSKPLPGWFGALF